MSAYNVPTWNDDDFFAAMAQGWSVFDSEGSVDGPIQVQRYDDAEMVGSDYGRPCTQLDGDQEAWDAFREAYLRGEPHAVKAYEFFRDTPDARQEWNNLGMGNWGMPIAA